MVKNNLAILLLNCAMMVIQLLEMDALQPVSKRLDGLVLELSIF